MPITQHLKLAFTSSLLALVLASCGSTTAITASAERFPAHLRVTLDSDVTGEQKDKIRKATSIHFGGFSGGQWGGSGVIGAVLMSLNGESGEHSFSGDLAYNNALTGSFSVTSISGYLKVVAKPDHHQIPDDHENHFGFQAKPGHHYFIGYIVDDKNMRFRWVPVCYDKTEEKVVPLNGAFPKSAPKPLKIVLYV